MPRFQGEHLSNRVRMNGAVSRLAFAGLVVVGGIAAQAHGQCMYEVTIVQAAPCGDGDIPELDLRGISSVGTACGTQCASCSCFSDQPIAWISGNIVQLEDPEKNDTADARDINASGEVVGCSTFPGKWARFGEIATVWREGKAIPLGLTNGANVSYASAINDAGVIVGASADIVDADPPWQAVLWEDDVLINVGERLSGFSSRADDINAAGVVCGRVSDGGQFGDRGFIWSEGRTTVLPAVPGGLTSIAVAINDRNMLAVEGAAADNSRGLGFLWDAGSMTMLHDLPNQDDVDVNDINDAGQIVGMADIKAGLSRGVIWQGDSVRDLNDWIVTSEIVHVASARAINDRGQIAAAVFVGPFPFEEYAAAILTPVGSADADVNIDCHVDEADLAILLEDWGQSELPTDIDEDGVVGPRDLAILLSQWSD